MKKIKNIFLTTLNENRGRLDVNYFVCEKPDASLNFSTGISVAEAGIKYMLSSHMIDEIIVIGDPSLAKEDVTECTVLEDYPLFNISSLDEMSEYRFLLYRIAEFMNQVDFEIVDVSELIPDDRRETLKRAINAFRHEYLSDRSYRELFLALAGNKEVLDAFSERVLSSCTEDERKWVKYFIFNEMDSFYKMHILEANKKASIRFIPIEYDGGISIESINSIVRQTVSEHPDGINLFMDVQGMVANDGNTLISTFMLMSRRIGYGCNMSGLIFSSNSPTDFAGRVSNVIESYDIGNLISAIDVFLKYGKTDMIRECRRGLDVDDPEADRLFAGMDCIDEGITLCNVDLIEYGIKTIRKAIFAMAPDTLQNNIFMDIIISAIKADYGNLLKGDELSIVELLKWSHRKGLYQQTLTVIESKIPEDMVKRGIYYYAQKEEDVVKVLRELNVLYWNDSVKNRWAYSEVEHYFIKNYGRGNVDLRQKPDMVAKDYARLKIDAIHGRADGLLPAFSELHNDDLLLELLLSYYRIGNLRNQVNHAVVEDTNLVSDEPAARKDNRQLLDGEISKFIGLYNSACKKTVKENEPAILSAGRLKNYVRHHELKPVETSPERALENYFSCEYNGKEIQISIAMLKPDEYAEED